MFPVVPVEMTSHVVQMAFYLMTALGVLVSAVLNFRG